MKKTKIICTLGPNSTNLELIKKMVSAGMNIARLNLSHGGHDEQGERIKLVRQASAELGITVGILADIQGPKIRTGILPCEPMELQENDKIKLSCDPAKEQTEGYIYIKYPTLIEDSIPGKQIFLAEGLIVLDILENDGKEVLCQVAHGGKLVSKKGVSFPGVSVSLPAMTEKDQADIKFAVENDLAFIAVSFARKAEHIEEIRQYVKSLGGHQLLIAKIENEEGYQNSEEIVEAADAIMVARGDLGIELPPEEVPLIQGDLIRLCNRNGKPVITATEMLESMIYNPRPTRAEVSDVANAIFDGTDAIMLSGETAAGKYPLEAVKMMARVAEHIEESETYKKVLSRKRIEGAQANTSDAISHATCQTAGDLGAVAIITSTRTGNTARLVSKYRPQAPILAATASDRVARQLTLNWGVYSAVIPRSDYLDEMFETVVKAAKDRGFAQEGEVVVITAAATAKAPGCTNLLKVHTVN